MTGWLVLALAASNVHFARKYLKYRARVMQTGVFRPWPIRTISLEDLDPVFRTDEFGPTTDAMVSFLGRGALNVPGGVSDTETWVLAALATRAQSIFEFGTCTGKTTLHLAANSAPSARVTTLTLAPDQVDAYERTPADDSRLAEVAIRESRFARFIYTNTPAADKITQVFSDSKHFDETPYLGKMDLIFVDGSHAYSYVLSDSEKAFRMVAPGGLILWHDYRGPYETKDVFRALNELARTRPLMRPQGTSFVAYRAPAA